MGFAEEFIEAFQVGQQHQDQKLNRAHRQKQMQWDEEDRVIEKDLLQHRIRELKIGEKIQARNLARENIQDLQGTPTADLTPEMTEGGVLPASSPTNPQSLITLMKQMKVPGVEELGVEGYSARPQTYEQVTQAGLAKTLQEALIKNRTAIHNLPMGAKAIQDGEVVAENPREPKYVKIRRRGKDGKMIETLVPESEAIGLEQEIERLPSNNTTVVVNDNDLTDIADAIARGDQPADLTGFRGQDRVRIAAMLAKRGFNTTRAVQDQKAVAANLQTLNGTQITELRTLGDALDLALADLEQINETWNRADWGVLNWANILKSGNKDAENAARAAGQLLSQLQANGSAPTNLALQEAARELSAGKGQTDLRGVIQRARRAANYRISAIRNLEAITTERNSVDADFDFDPATGSLVPRKK